MCEGVRDVCVCMYVCMYVHIGICLHQVMSELFAMDDLRVSGMYVCMYVCMYMRV